MLQLWEDPGSFGLIIPYIQNIDSISVHRIEELTDALPNFPHSTPNLRSLALLSTYPSAILDRTADPFKSFPHTLKCLSLFNIPLYPSLHNLRTLTDLTLRYLRFDGHVDTLLTFLEQNCSLERATLDIQFARPSLRHSQHQAAVKNRLQHLSDSLQQSDGCPSPHFQHRAPERCTSRNLLSQPGQGIERRFVRHSHEPPFEPLLPHFLGIRSYPRNI